MRFFLILAILDLILILYCLSLKNYIFLLNSQVAIIASLAVTFGSFLGYKSLVIKKSKEQILDDKDYIDRLEDPYDLYSKDESKDPKELLKKEKKRIKKENLKNFLLTSSGFFSFYRLFGYLILIVSVLMLIDKGLFDAISFMVGLSLVPVAVLIYAFFRR